MLTLHAAGGAAMIAAARAAAEAAGADRPILLAVTVLTSMDAAALAATGVAGEPGRAGAAPRPVWRWPPGPMAWSARRRRSPPSAPHSARRRCLVVPGVRPAGSAAGDQARTATPAEAVAAGADWIVVGRPITGAADPVAALRAIAGSLPR